MNSENPQSLITNATMNAALMTTDMAMIVKIRALISR
jgi:hypothetical protein